MELYLRYPMCVHCVRRDNFAATYLNSRNSTVECVDLRVRYMADDWEILVELDVRRANRI